MPTWLVSLSLQGRRRDACWEQLQEASTGLSTNSKLEIPELRVGTLDTLMALSDDLVKCNMLMEGVVGKLRRQVTEVGGAASASSLKVDGFTADTFLSRFKWDEAKFPVRRPLREAVEKMTEIVGRIDEDLKVRVSEYNGLKTQLSAMARKTTGSLAVRDIASLVKPKHVVESENLTTLFVVVPKFGLREWEGSYEKLSSFVVPRSSQPLSEDQDYALCTVVLFKRVLDDFKAAARSKGYQIREYIPPDAGSGHQLTEAQAEQLRKDVDAKKASLENWCKTAYGEAFSAWVHMSCIRLFVESILRYGLPPAFQAAVMRVGDKAETKARNVMASTFGDGKSSFWKDDGNNPVGANVAGTDELFPYVSLNLNIE